MEDSTNFFIWVFIILISLSLIITIGIHQYHKLDIDNFKSTIKELSQEQKCIYICGFEFKGYSETYKMCLEKCDRISERNCIEED